MYAQCPACLTTFTVTAAQLAARSGLVRCGVCSAVFNAEEHLLQVPQANAASAPADATSSAKNKRGRTGKNRSDSSPRARSKVKRRPLTDTNDPGIPVVTRLRRTSNPRDFWRAFFWSFGNLLLLLGLAGQFVYFYRDELATQTDWRSTIVNFCDLTGCALRPRQDITRIELLQTTIAPHPEYENAFRIRASLVNRATFAQAYPNMEVSLTNNAGAVLTRRAFNPAQYRETSAAEPLTPNRVATALLDITNPEGKAVGYEIRLVAP
jgi:predicted Zn finger-like uncharacterized protein